MARLLTFDPVNDTNSEEFKPVGNFCVHRVGAITANVTYTIEQSPIEEDAWVPAEGTNTGFTGTNRVAQVNYFYGFRYRIAKSGSGTEAATDIKFYMGVAVVVDSLEARN